MLGYGTIMVLADEDIQLVRKRSLQTNIKMYQWSLKMDT